MLVKPHGDNRAKSFDASKGPLARMRSALDRTPPPFGTHFSLLAGALI